VCHSVESASLDGNGSYRLRRDEVPLPVEGDAASLAAHRARLSLRGAKSEHLCASCHRGFLGQETGHGHHIGGVDDVSPWLSSVYAGSRQARVDEPSELASCRGCHMPQVAGQGGPKGKMRRSHRFAGAHSWLAAMRGDREQLEVVQRQLEGAASIDVVALRLADGRRLWLPSDVESLAGLHAFELEVVVKNQRVGHHFPGGTRDIQDVWIALTIEDADGQLLAESGMDAWEPGHEGDGRSSVAEPPPGQTAPGQEVRSEAHRLSAVLIDEQGRPVAAHEVHRFRTSVYDHTVAPRDRALVRYSVSLPRLDEARQPWRIRARLMHRSRDRATWLAGCAATRSATGQAFARAERALGDKSRDGCASPPITIVAEQTTPLGGAAGGREQAGSLAAAERLIDHGAAWGHALVEQLDEGRPSLEHALEIASSPQLRAAPSAARVRAAALHQLALIAARQGRADEAVMWATRADKDAPGHPALARARGVALAAVWRYEEALVWLRVAASSSPRDEAGWSDLATALGSTARFDSALSASMRGLELAPRHADLLRVQALALREMPAPAALRREAEEAFLRYRVRDDGSALRSRCSMEVVGCAQERTPVHLHALTYR
jgi:tetratricopeptide (TPR) repeat protein